MDRPRLCVLGSMNTDLVVRAPRLPAPGETLIGGAFRTMHGGKGANQAVAAARMGAGVSFVGAVGDDEHGRGLVAALGAEGIDVSRVRARVDAPTGVAVITVAEPGGENTIVVAPGANATLTPADVDAAREAIAGADALLMQLETPLDVVVHAAGVAREVGTMVILNAAPGQRLPAELLAAVDALVVNESEAAVVGSTAFAPMAPIDEAADELERVLVRLALLGPATTVLTAGARGALYAYGTDRGRVPATAVTPIDTVGAGDAFCGAFAARLSEHQINAGRVGLDRLAVMDAVCWGCAAGALATTRAGAMDAMPGRAEVVGMLRRRE